MRILVVDDNAGIREDLKADLPAMVAGVEIEVEAVDSFGAAEELLRDRRLQFDLVILDVKDESEGGSLVAGSDLYRRLIDASWLPVVFYTGVPGEVADLAAPPLVAVVAKDRGDELADAVAAALASEAAGLARALVAMVEGRIRSFLGAHVAPNWSAYSVLEKDQLMQVLVSRTAAWLREWSDERDLQPIGHEALPAFLYLLPPIARTGLRAGSLVVDGGGQRWLVLTPSCDLFTNEDLPDQPKLRGPKAERVLLARVIAAAEQPIVGAYIREGTKKADAQQLLGNRAEARWYFLPEFLGVAAGFVDLEDVSSQPTRDVMTWARIADLDAPFAESIVARHAGWRGRIGTPDLNTAPILESLRPTQ